VVLPSVMANDSPSSVAPVYDRIAGWFDSNRVRTLIERPYLDAVMEALPPGAAILDLGCGTANPSCAT